MKRYGIRFNDFRSMLGRNSIQDETPAGFRETVDLKPQT